MSVDPNDCPAAHSMDTTWFAVDADGNIGVFDSGEAGGVPMNAAVGFGEGGAIDTWALDVLRLARVLVTAIEAKEKLPAASDARAGARVTVVIDRARGEARDTYRDHGGVGPFERALGASIWTVREAAPRIVSTREPLDAAAARALANDATVVGVIDERDLREWLDPKAEASIFSWWNEDYADAGAYVRKSVPRHPIRLDDLPDTLAETISRARIDTSFAASEALQLRDHFAPEDVAAWNETGTLVEPTERDEEDDEDENENENEKHPEARKGGDRRMLVAMLVMIAIGVLVLWLRG